MINEIINDTGDDRNLVGKENNGFLIIEDDVRFARIIIEKHTRGFESCCGNGPGDVHCL
jgi:hypothetical protein